LKTIGFAIPGDLAAPTGGYAYDRQLIKRLPAFGIEPLVIGLPGSFPHPSDADLSESSRRLLAAPFDAPLLIDGLAYGAFPTGLAAGLAGRVAALVHHPLALETGTPPERAAELKRLEAAALSYAAAVIVTGAPTRDILVSDYGVPAERISVAVPGVEPAARASESAFGQPVRLLAVGSLTRRKGYDDLIRALAPIAGLPWSLTIAGAADRAPAFATELRGLIAEAGLGERITLAGAVDDATLAALYASADLFVLASRYEGYGMALTEALARGIPCVATRCGAAVDDAPDTAVQKVAPGNVGDLTGALAYLIGDGGARRRHADSAWSHAANLPRWDDTARIVASVLTAIKP
jgi:glycosyltransferase involved in cell wall biosynthesis